jgi:very-short-patch-repair endonuclease
MLVRNALPKKMNIWERLFKSFAESRGYLCYYGYRIKGEAHPYDFYIPELNLIIELDGCWNHRCLDCFSHLPEDGIRSKDLYLTMFAVSHGYDVLRIKWHDYVKIGSDVFRNSIEDWLQCKIKDAA